MFGVMYSWNINIHLEEGDFFGEPSIVLFGYIAICKACNFIFS